MSAQNYIKNLQYQILFKYRPQTPKALRQYLNHACNTMECNYKYFKQDVIAQSFLTQDQLHERAQLFQIYYQQLRSNLKYIQISFENQIHWRNAKQSLVISPLQNDKVFRQYKSQDLQQLKLLIDISTIKYQNLLQLYFFIFDFSNIEPLGWLNCPLLRDLVIQQPNWTHWNMVQEKNGEFKGSISVKPLAKMNLKQLNRVSITHKFNGNSSKHFACNRMRKNRQNNCFKLKNQYYQQISFIELFKSQANELFKNQANFVIQL